MARIRTIKPQFFKHEELFDAEKSSGLPLRIAYAGLWTVCDREGRFAWKPRALKTDVLPYDDVDFSAVLDALAGHGFIVRYTVGGKEYGCVPSFGDHQVLNNRESESCIPEPPSPIDACPTRAPRVPDASPRVDDFENPAQGEKERKGREKEKEKEGKENNTSATHVSPEMVAQAVRTELGIAGRELLIALDAVCRSELQKGRDPTELRDALIAAWRDYEQAKARNELAWMTGAAKFFGDGMWRNKAGWPRREGRQGNGSNQQNRGRDRVNQQLEELAKAGVVFAPGGAEESSGQDGSAPRGSSGCDTSGVVLEGAR